jgi:flagellin-like hook-associated protein FlgL
MSDISIPTGAMMALYNLKQIGADLVTTQNEISTGRIVNGPKTIVRFGSKPKR